MKLYFHDKFLFPDKYTIPSMTFKWRDDPPLSFPSDFGKDGYRLPKYVVSFRAEEEQHIVYYGEGMRFTIAYW